MPPSKIPTLAAIATKITVNVHAITLGSVTPSISVKVRPHSGQRGCVSPRQLYWQKGHTASVAFMNSMRYDSPDTTATPGAAGTSGNCIEFLLASGTRSAVTTAGISKAATTGSTALDFATGAKNSSSDI